MSSRERWCGGTVWNGEAAIRLNVCSFMTGADDIARSAAAFRVSMQDERVRAFLLQGFENAPEGRLAGRANVEVVERAVPVLSGFPATADADRGPALCGAGNRSIYLRPASAGRRRAFSLFKRSHLPQGGALGAR